MCSKSHEEMSAEEVVEAYLELVFNMESQDEKEKLLEYTTGDLEAAIAGATESAIIEAYIKPRYLLKRFSIVERQDRTPRETEISFQLQYKDLPEGKTKFEEAAEFTTENKVAVIKENGKWLISDVLGNKTSIEFPITELSKITASANAASTTEEGSETDSQPSLNSATTEPEQNAAEGEKKAANTTVEKPKDNKPKDPHGHEHGHDHEH